MNHVHAMVVSSVAKKEKKERKQVKQIRLGCQGDVDVAVFRSARLLHRGRVGRG